MSVSFTNNLNIAKSIASKIFDHGLEDEEETSVYLCLTWLDGIYYKLKKKNNPLSKKVASALQDLVQEYCQEHNLCPDCYEELDCRTTKYATWDEPGESETYCRNCGYVED